MSWFDTAGIASLAKNALKEAQRTIDKALDIKDDDPAPSKVVAASTSAAEDESDGFFSSWGIKSPTSSLDVSTSKQGTPSAADLAVQHEPTPSTNNLWGSFTGSFFDADNKAEPEPGSTEDQPDTALVLRQPKKVTLEAVGTKQPPSSLGLARQNRGRNVAPFNPNRLSVISSSTGSPDEGGSESVEVLGSTSESSLSPETAEACQRLAEQSSPESVGIIAGGSSSDLTSPSSVEVLGWSEANSPCSPLRPLTLFPVRPQQQQPPLQSPVSDLLTPESVEVINEEESEASLADDSSTSASSTTTTTVMEPRVAAIELTASAHMRTMLAEAMEEQASSHSSEHSSQTAGRDQHSPVSSLTSEPIKIECGQLSGQTSGDELETATSSDIEIISSPNGDSSSTHSRHSPTKLHPLVSVVRAELPSSGSPDSSTSERAPLRLPGIDPNAPSEEMLKKIHELHGLLEVRESKLFELSKNNIELQESNTDLQKQLEAGLQKQAANTQDVSQITEEFTQRLSALERRFQQAIRDKEALKRQLDSAKQEASGKVDVSELQAIVAEKDEEIKELRLEGEKLSKQQLQLSTLVKKLRAKEKEMETASKTNKQHLSELNQEAERLKKSLSAKEEVERSQIEAVNRLTAQVKRQDRELSAAQIQLNDMKEEKDRLQDSLDSINKEMTELRSLQLSSELAQRQVLSQQLEEKQVEINQLKITHERELEALRLEFTSSSASGSQREEQLRREHNAVLKKLQAAEARAEELAHCTSDSTKPLLRQLEALQASASSQQQLAERSERQLCDKISELQAKLTAISEQERLSRDRNSTINAQLVALQTEIATLTATHKELQVACTTYQHEKQTLSQSIKGIQEQHKEEVEGLRKEISLMKDQLAVQQAATEAEKRHVAALEFKLKQAEVARSQMLEQNPLTVSISHQAASQSPPRASPAPSLSDSVASTSWLPDDVLEGVGVLSLANEIASGGATSALLEGLQSQVKRRDGETALLRSQTKRLEAQRTELASQVATLLSKAETQAAELQRLSELERKYDALLQMYGEQLEANQELRMDLDDVKEMYRTQIEALLGTNGSQPPL
ncbi:TATA element modulatory factor-like isoform X2 [Neocloeon triangulifer]|uniref:TATA element modulatory factor-like isoform X2 n=1 Tax=Neocloeon triangulifer TaxID=2078957 RepID=UPI00286F9CBC|nr:TATA element modulatory factor-like isoform X2 [Neocloeon triangulifer]